MARTCLVTTLLLASAGVADAGPFGRRAAYSAPQPAVVYQQPAAVYHTTPSYATTAVRFPRLAAVALATGPFDAPGAPPPLGSGQLRRAAAPRGVIATFAVFSYLAAPYSGIGLAVPPAIRLAHVRLNGSPYAGHPGQTMLWVASPWAARVRENRLEARGQYLRPERYAMGY